MLKFTFEIFNEILSPIFNLEIFSHLCYMVDFDGPPLKTPGGGRGGVENPPVQFLGVGARQFIIINRRNIDLTVE